MKPAYLETLAVGTHTLDIVSTNGTASTSFTIKAATTNPDDNNQGGNGGGNTNPGGTTGDNTGNNGGNTNQGGNTGNNNGGNSNTGNKPNPNTGVTSPQTGDNSNMFLWIALLAASACGLVSTMVISRRKRA